MKLPELQEKYFALWAAIFPILTFLVVPSIQGTTPTYLMALLSFCWVPFIRRDKAALYMRNLLLFGGLWLAFLLVSQLGIYFSGVQTLPKTIMVDYKDDKLLFRTSLFTQSIYLFACYFTFLFFVYVYQSEWQKHLFIGAWILVLYGLYEWVYFFVMQQPGDFLSNRIFLGGEHPGSWSQTFQLGKVNLLRIKSTTGEPSMFALTAIPYLILSLSAKRWYLATALLAALVLTFSTSAFLSLGLLAAYSFFYFKAWRGRYLPYWLAAGVAVVSLYFLNPELTEVLFEKKLSGEGGSGGLRKYFFETAWYTWLNSGFINKLVGIGFGNAFITPLIGGMLVNTGILGLGIFLCAFIYPFWKLPNTTDCWPIKAGLLVVFFMLTVSLAEFAYPTSWLVLGLAYRKLRRMGSSLVQPH